MQEEWSQTNLNLQAAREQIGDLNLQVTILTSGKTVICSCFHDFIPSPFTLIYVFNDFLV